MSYPWLVDQYDHADDQPHFATDGALMALPPEYYVEAPKPPVEKARRVGLWARLRKWLLF